MIEAIQFSSFSEFIEMGGYAFNVWSVYGLFTVFLIANLLIPMRRNKQIIRELKRRNLLNTEFNNGSTSNGSIVDNSDVDGEDQ
ncbi:MAG TPA: heme exporter protein CcmD [Gammaproteobacteria bacterium]|jgi:heme exporter protein D|nr:heme exporter protein CcmD [Gammaproteobacteria bacterium]MDP6732959.1 heme exporter protein CcmD [Gammaproteobacteria bacterium]HAJ76344.1 heme exporter protein CcmD [Gammaproteobacteria bacterium]|tara:strand:- start:42 stop:293 length:252 start_codon:yes stop_codon:yes gene_type:complete